MTRKDYRLIADAIRPEVEFATADPAMSQLRVTTLRHVVSNLSTALAKDNPRFDTDRFLTACGF